MTPSAMALALLSLDHTCMSCDLNTPPHVQLHNQTVLLRVDCDQMAVFDMRWGLCRTFCTYNIT